MKKIILIFALFTLFSCDNETAVIETPEENNTILGRWHLVGFEQTVMYDFKAEFRHTIMLQMVLLDLPKPMQYLIQILGI